MGIVLLTFLAGNSLGALMIGYFLVRYGRKDAFEFASILLVWNALSVVTTVLMVVATELIPFEVFALAGRDLLGW